MKKLMSAGVCFLAAAALAGCGTDDDTTAETTDTATVETTTTSETTTSESTTTTEAEEQTVVRITVVNGSPKGGIVRATVQKGDRVVIVVRSDVADEVHLHGYDVSRDVAAGGTARLRFEATIPGRFEVELEERGAQVADITVEP